MNARTPATILLLALPLLAQDDRIRLVDGKEVEGARVISFDVRELKYSKGGATEMVPSDRVVQVTLGKFKDIYRRGESSKDGEEYLPVARDQLAAKNPLMAQVGFIAAAKAHFDNDKAAMAVGALDELEKALPEAGVIPDVYRLKFEYYISRGDKNAAQSALSVARKYTTAAAGGAWPAGFGLEAEFFTALAERVSGGDPKAYQGKLRDIMNRALGTQPMVANRANMQLANSLRETGDKEGARKIYQDLVNKDNIDDSSRAGGYLGLGLLKMAEGDAANRDPFHEALLLFLRVRLETKDAWGSLQAEALYNAMLAAEKWGGPDFRYIHGRCRAVLRNEFPNSEWAALAK